MITHLEPDILECEVKWALESITTSKASGGDAALNMPANLENSAVATGLEKFSFQSQKFSFQSQRKAMPKNVQTTTQLHSSHMLVK